MIPVSNNMQIAPSKGLPLENCKIPFINNAIPIKMDNPMHIFALVLFLPDKNTLFPLSNLSSAHSITIPSTKISIISLIKVN